MFHESKGFESIELMLPQSAESTMLSRVTILVHLLNATSALYFLSAFFFFFSNIM
jgi:hypothetical protein